MTVHRWRLVPPPGVRFILMGGNDVDVEIPEERLAEVAEWFGDNHQALAEALGGVVQDQTGEHQGEPQGPVPAVNGRAGFAGEAAQTKAPATSNPLMLGMAPMSANNPVQGGLRAPPSPAMHAPFPAQPAASQQFSPFAIQPPAAAGGAAGFMVSQPPIAPPPPPHGTQAAPSHPQQTAGGVPILPQPPVARPPRPPALIDPRAGIPNVSGGLPIDPNVEPVNATPRVPRILARMGRAGGGAMTAQERSLAALAGTPAMGSSDPASGPGGGNGTVPDNGIALVQTGVDEAGRPVFQGKATGEPIAVLPQPGITPPPPPPAGPPARPEEFLPMRGQDLGGCRGCNGHGVRFSALDVMRTVPKRCTECNGTGVASANGSPPPADSSASVEDARNAAPDAEAPPPAE